VKEKEGDSNNKNSLWRRWRHWQWHTFCHRQCHKVYCCCQESFALPVSANDFLIAKSARTEFRKCCNCWFRKLGRISRLNHECELTDLISIPQVAAKMRNICSNFRFEDSNLMDEEIAVKDRYIVNVEGAILKDRRYLLVVRGPGETHAAGTLSLVGGKVENAGESADILEATLRREILEEVGLEIGAMEYLHSKSFGSASEPVVDVIFLCAFSGGEAKVIDPDEVAAIRWMSAQEVQDDPDAPIWTKQDVQAAEAKRLKLGW
jgi:8-oxo-dGTP diphosphatase